MNIGLGEERGKGKEQKRREEDRDWKGGEEDEIVGREGRGWKRRNGNRRGERKEYWTIDRTEGKRRGGGRRGEEEEKRGDRWERNIEGI